jgi:hypothetical protein
MIFLGEEPMNPADSPHNSPPPNFEGNQKPYAPTAYIRGLGAALAKWETIKGMQSQRDDSEMEGNG